MLDLKHEPTHFCGCCPICVRFFFLPILPCNFSTVLNCCVGNYLAGKKSTSPESMLEVKVLVSHCLITMS